LPNTGLNPGNSSSALPVGAILLVTLCSAYYIRKRQIS
jgi:hypothetical protein